MDNNSKIRKNPSRETCESIIKRILITEFLKNGTNSHFKYASDFMGYFESLYPASEGLYKQVQRAIKSMNMPKDSNGYYIINKTNEQLDQEKAINQLLRKNKAELLPMVSYEAVLLKLAPAAANYLMQLISDCETFDGLLITMVEAYNGVLFYTETKEKLLEALQTLLDKQ